MKKRHHTPEQIIRKLAEGDRMLNEGASVDEVARHLEITASTWHRWKAQYGVARTRERWTPNREEPRWLS